MVSIKEIKVEFNITNKICLYHGHIKYYLYFLVYLFSCLDVA